MDTIEELKGLIPEDMGAYESWRNDILTSKKNKIKYLSELLFGLEMVLDGYKTYAAYYLFNDEEHIEDFDGADYLAAVLYNAVYHYGEHRENDARRMLKYKLEGRFNADNIVEVLKGISEGHPLMNFVKRFPDPINIGDLIAHARHYNELPEQLVEHIKSKLNSSPAAKSRTKTDKAVFIMEFLFDHGIMNLTLDKLVSYFGEIAKRETFNKARVMAIDNKRGRMKKG